MKDVKNLMQQPGSTLATILARAQRIVEVERCILPAIDAQVREHCRVGHIEAGVLLLLVDSPVWATRLRFSLPSLLEKLKAQEAFADLRDITVKVGLLPPSPEQTVKPSSAPHPLSDDSRQQLKALAEGIEDPALKEALTRLAKKPSP